MKSVFLLCGALAVSNASECQADEQSLLQAKKSVRKHAQGDSQAVLNSVRDVANSLLEGSDTTLTSDEVNDALTAASNAIAQLSPAIQQQIANVQQQINDAASAVQVCHAQDSADVRTARREYVQHRSSVVESCQDTHTHFLADAERQCGIAEDCLCDEARQRATDQEALCASMLETYEAAFCEHHHLCTIFHECHVAEAAVFVSMRADAEAEMAITVQEYIAVEQSQCITGLIMQSLTPPRTPVSHAALIACDDVDVSGIAIQYPNLPAQPAACPAHQHGEPQCVSVGAPAATTPAPVLDDCRLQAYWEYGGCGCGGNDQNANWCGGLGSGNCPQTVSVSANICPSGTAYRAEWHPKPYGGNSHRGRGTPGHFISEGCEYIWHAQYACQSEQSD